jgi:hypothetical protein
LALLILIPLALPATVLNQTPRLPEVEGRVYADPREEADSEEDDDDPVERVARITHVQGDVSFLRAGVEEWADAVENIPLLTGDQIYAARGGRVEIQLSRGNYVRLGEQTALTITDLTHTIAQLEITEGTALVRLERFGSAFNRFEVDTPNAALLLKRDGFYRVNVRGDDYSEVIARAGSVEVTTDDGLFTVREGHRLIIDTGRDGRLEIALDSTRDDWDRWSRDRDTTIDRYSVSLAPDYVRSYESNYNCFYGASDLYDYGTWTSYGSYGQCWIPRVSSGWAPYRNGQWLWSPRVGWTWWSREPWGWAPYHYGRWVFLNGHGWAWVPGFGSSYTILGHRYYQWRPALVSFFNCPTPRGQYVGWYPLRPGERWRRPDHRDNRLRYPGEDDRWRRPQNNDNWRRPAGRDGITTIPVEGFARPDRSRLRPGAPDRDVSGWISGGARPGLPDIGARGWVTSPVGRSSDGEPRPRRSFSPPTDVITRPVVTRNRPTDSDSDNRPSRERRLLNPRKDTRGDSGTVVHAPGERRSSHSDDHSDGDSSKRGDQDSDKDNRWTRPRNDAGARASSSDRNRDGDREDSSRRRRGNDDSNNRRNKDNDDDSSDSSDRKPRDRDKDSDNSNDRRPRSRGNDSNDSGDKSPGYRYIPPPKKEGDSTGSGRSRERRSGDNNGSSDNSRPRTDDSSRNRSNNDSSQNNNNNSWRNRDNSDSRPRVNERSNDKPKDSDRGNSRQDRGDRKRGND